MPQASLKAAAVASGYANLEIDTAVGLWFFPYQTDPPPGQSPLPVTVNLGNRPKYPCGYEPDKVPWGESGFALERPRAPASAVVGQGYIIRQRHTKGDWVKFDYDQGASHTQASALGVGISGYGFDAGYTTAGAHMSKVVRGEGFGSWYRSTWFRTEFKTGQYREMCYGASGTKVPHLHQHGRCPKKYHDHGITYPVHKCLWLIHSRGWFGGATELFPKHAPPTSTDNCARQARKSYFHYDNGVAIKWSQGFELGAALDIKGITLKADFNGSAQTGYDANAQMRFKFHQAGWICGTNGAPANAAQLVARANKR